MSVTLTINGSSYPFPETGESSWGDSTTEAVQALASAALYPVDVQNNLTSSSTTDVLSAAMGKSLQDNKPAKVSPSVADNVVTFSNTTGVQKDSGISSTTLSIKVNPSVADNIVTFSNTTGTQKDSGVVITGFPSKVSPSVTNNVVAFSNATGSQNDSGYNSNEFLFEGVRRNCVINGNFDIWQRGTSFTNPASTTYTADRWRVLKADVSGTAPNVNVARATTVPSDDKSIYSCKLSPTSTGVYGSGMYWLLGQYFEDFIKFRDQVVTVHLQVQAPMGSQYRIAVYDGSISDYSTVKTGNGSFQDVIFNSTVGSSVASLAVFILLAESSTVSPFLATVGDYYVSQVQVFARQNGSVSSTTAIPYSPYSVGEEIQKCLRYYERQTGGGTAFGAGVQKSATNSTFAINFYPKYTTPTMAIGGDLRVEGGGVSLGSVVITASSYCGNSTGRLNVDHASGGASTDAVFLTDNSDVTAYVEILADYSG